MRKILIINRLGIGDVVLTTSLARIIKENMKDVAVGFLVASKAVDLLKNHIYIDDVFSYRNRNEKKSLIGSIKNKGYTDAIIVDGRLSSTIIAWKSGCNLLNKGLCFSIGRKHFFGRKELKSRAIEDFTFYADKLLNLKYDEKNLFPLIGNCSESRKSFILNWVNDIKNRTNKIVLIVARTAAEIKNWNVDELGKLNIFLNERGIYPIYIGAPSDKEYINSISGEKINIAGEFTLRELPEIGKYADWALSMCTGPLHILGTVQNLPILAIYGPSDPLRWAPKSAIVIQSELECVPCLDWAECTKAKGERCMDKIKFEQVRDIIFANKLL